MKKLNDNDILKRFIEMLIVERGISKNTVISYNRDINDLLLYTKTKEREVLSIDYNFLVDFISELRSKKLNAKTISRKISAYRQFFNFLVLEKLCKENPALNLPMPKKGFSLPKSLSRNTIDKIIKISKAKNTKKALRANAMVEILYSTGMRVSELITLEVNAIENRDKKYGVRSIIIKGKGNKERVVLLNESAGDALENYLGIRAKFLKKGSNCKWLFPSYTKDNKVTHVTRQRLGQILKDLAKSAGINPTLLSPHKIRHSFATHMLENGANLRIVQELLGHSDISSTQIYTDISKTKAKKLLLEKHPLAEKDK